MGIGSTARKPVGYQTAFLRKRFTRAGGAAQTITVGQIPAGANIMRAFQHTRVAFDGTTPVFSLGVAGTVAGIAASGAHGLASVGATPIALAAANVVQVPDADITVIATFTVTGGTVGTSDITIEYTVPDETP